MSDFGSYSCNLSACIYLLHLLSVQLALHCTPRFTLSSDIEIWCKKSSCKHIWTSGKTLLARTLSVMLLIISSRMKTFLVHFVTFREQTDFVWLIVYIAPDSFQGFLNKLLVWKDKISFFIRIARTFRYQSTFFFSTQQFK